MPTTTTSTVGLRDSDTKSLAPAYADVIQSLAGRVALLRELITGSSGLSSDEQAISSKNPRGRIGIDYSGPPFGSAMRTPVFICGGIKTDVSGDWEGQRQVGQVVSGANLVLPVRWWQKPFARGARVPYSRVLLSIRAYQSAAVAAFTVSVIARSSPGRSELERGATMNVASTSQTYFTLLSTCYLDAVPGWNEAEIEFRTSSTTAAIISQVTGYNGVKRSH